jgi:hypothetical protein
MTTKISVPLIISTCGKKPESVIVWARTDIKVKDARNMLSRSVLHGLGRENEMKEDREGLFVTLGVEAGCGEDRKKYPAQRFEVKDHVDFEVSLGGGFCQGSWGSGHERGVLELGAEGNEGPGSNGG